MGSYAKIESGIVTWVIVADADFISGQGGTWVETKRDGSIRNKFAANGDTYDSDNDVFYSPRPHASWTLDSDYIWQPPVAVPSDWNPGVKNYQWNEDTESWEES
jgi:hypothetical protein